MGWLTPNTKSIMQSLASAMKIACRLNHQHERNPIHSEGDLLYAQNGRSLVVLEVYPYSPIEIEYTVLTEGDVYDKVGEKTLAAWFRGYL